MAYCNKILSLFILINVIVDNSWAQFPCENGLAWIYPCRNVDLQSLVTPAELLAQNTSGILLNDIWGWTDPDTGKEYALVGMTNGTSFVDISDPVNPVVLGILPEHESATGRSAKANSVWRDLKVFKNHVFIVSEDPIHGMQIFNLENLRNVENAPETFSETAHYDGIGGAHNLAINESSGFAYVTGGRESSICNGGGLYIIDINDPVNPKYAGCFDQPNLFTHDAQCVIYNGPDPDYTGKEICFNLNESKITVADLTDKSNPSMISNMVYDGLQYAHQGWLSEDQRYFFSNDEIDELSNGGRTRTFVWNMEDLDNPVLASTFEHQGSTIDHNLYVKGPLIFQSNYTAGLRVLDFTTLLSSGLKEVAYFDTYRQDDIPTFNGAWSNYPFFESGNVIVSDITNGLFVLKLNDSIIEGLDKQTIDSDLALYPNPTDDYFTINSSQLVSPETFMQVIDFSGKEVMRWRLLIELNADQEILFDVSALNKGIYNIRFTSAQNTVTKRLAINQ